MRRKGLPVIGGALLALASCAFGQEQSASLRLAKEASRAYAAFESAHFAFAAGDREELGQKLLRLGFDSGKKFMIGAKAGKVTAQDIRENMPLVFHLLNTGPNEDFVLGRIFEAAKEDCDKMQEEARKPFADGSFRTDEDVRRLMNDELRKRNAELLLPEKDE
jgi:hypothetical protein